MKSMSRNFLTRLTRSLSRLRGAGRSVVLTYHRVLPEPDAMRPGETTAREFDVQMRTIASAFASETFRSFIQRRRSGSKLGNTIIVTFDDGYKDNLEVALPILRKYGIRATFFITTGFLNGGMMWNDQLIEAMREAVGRTVDLSEAGLGRVPVKTLEDAQQKSSFVLSSIKRWPREKRSEFVNTFGRSVGADLDRNIMMSAGEIAALEDNGMEIGAHTVSHPILSTLTPEDARAEITRCKSTLESIIQRRVTSFAYPNGRPGKDFSERDIENVKLAGYLGAVTTQWGCATPHSDDFSIPRQCVWGSNRLSVWRQLLRSFLSG